MPEFVREDPIGSSNDALKWGRVRIYERLWYDLLLQPRPENVLTVVADLRSGATAFTTAERLADYFSKVDPADRGLSTSATTLSRVFATAAGILNFAAASQAADWRAFEVYTALIGYAEAREELVQPATSDPTLDPNLRTGWQQSVTRIQADRDKEWADLSAEAVLRARSASVATSVTTHTVGGLVGKALMATVGAGSVGAAIAVALPAATSIGLVRTYERDLVEAELVLLATIDHAVLAPLDASSLPKCDRARVWELRSQLHFMAVERAKRWGGDLATGQPMLIDPNYRTNSGTTGRELAEKARTWANQALQVNRSDVDAMLAEEAAECRLQTPSSVVTATAATQSTSPQRLLIFDYSSSMAGQKLAEAKAAVRTTLAALDAGDQVALLAFGGRCQTSLLVDFTTDRQQLLDAIDRLNASGSTPIAAALNEATAIVRRSGNPGSMNVVLFTDGMETCTSGDAALGAASALGSALRTVAVQAPGSN